MITKILFTALVVVLVLLFSRHKAGRRRGGTPGRGPAQAPPRYVRLIPAALLLGLMAIGALTLWFEWQDAHRIFTARVIDTRTGEVRTYAVYRDDVEVRRFRTIDGRVVTLADVERMELVEGAPKGQ